MGCVSSKTNATVAEAKGEPSKTLICNKGGGYKAGQVAGVQGALPRKPADARSAGSDDPFITKLYNLSDFYLKITNGGEWGGQELSPPVGAVLTPQNHYNYCLFDYLIVEIRVGSDDGDYVGTASITVQGSGDGRYLSDENGFLLFAYDDAHSEYPGNDPWEYRRAMDVTVAKLSPPILTNSGWTSGMANTSSTPRSGDQFWLQDYGMDEQGRWYVSEGAICQTTEKIGENQGSRAYPALVTNAPPNPNWAYRASENGSGFTGVWQIAMKLGSDGSGSCGFCETFYLSERKDMAPGPSQYQDGSGTAQDGASSGIGREIDIMESMWKPEGPQANLPTSGDSQWGVFRSKQMGNWSDVGGLPLKDYVIFGVLIRDDNLWFYGYKPNGSQWYASDPIPKNSSYDQKWPFVPYIGTWKLGDSSAPGGFSTCYKDFVYLAVDDPKIAGKNPKDDPTVFGSALVSS